MAERKGNNGLVGKFFHSFTERGEISWQGCVKEVVSRTRYGMPNRYLVQLFSYIDGAASKEEIVHVNDMLKWHFYERAEGMRWAYPNFMWQHHPERNYKPDLDDAFQRAMKEKPLLRTDRKEVI